MSISTTMRRRCARTASTAALGLLLAGLGAGAVAPATAAGSEAAAEASRARPERAPETAVSSDGSVAKVRPERGVIESVPTGGTGSLADSTGVELAESATLEGTPIGIESILGTDDRWQVTNTTSYPARATVRIVSSVGQCTGWMIDDDTVATAGHCVHNGAWATNIRVTPGQNGSYAPYGSCTSRSVHSVLGWTRDRNHEYDYAAIKLNCTIGNTVGWYGMRWTTASLNGVGVYVAGYPGDKAAQQWWSYGTIRRSEVRKLYYTNDTVGGNSGGPVFQYLSDGPYGLAVHAYGTGDGVTNSGTRITEAAFNNYRYWRGL